MTGAGKNAVGVADLHVHTTASDGLFSAEEVVSLCERRGICAVAIADHDTLAGVVELVPARASEPGPAGHATSCVSSFHYRGVEIIPAVEINTELDGKEVHILGYFVPIDPGSEFAILLDTLRRFRMDRVRAMVSRLEELGLPVELERVLFFAKGESVGRPHVGQAMVEKGYVSSVKEAFERYLGTGKPAYVPRVHLTPVQAVRSIVRAGGVAVWAHPGTAGCDHLLEELVNNGLDGLECVHPQHSPEDTRRYAALAREYGLIATGGSDFHGPGSAEGGELGEWVVHYSVVTLLKEARVKRGLETAGR
ncbi:MAG: PHP domain-containing protein [Firmicutes bacterium]|nr:PHP domain-containing protein [Candidatus Fermentithermobacillaceae bacterium]